MRYHCATGLDDDLIVELVGRIREVLTGQGLDESQFDVDFDAQVAATLVLLRPDVTQMVVGELFGVRQATI